MEVLSCIFSDKKAGNRDDTIRVNGEQIGINAFGKILQLVQREGKGNARRRTYKEVPQQDRELV